MQILKRGVLTQRKFTCSICECEFVADPDEYTVTMADGKMFWCSSSCPECGVVTNISEIWNDDMKGTRCDEAER